MIIDICDPASKPKDRGFASLIGSVSMVWGSEPFLRGPSDKVQPADWGVVEAQWANPEASRQSLITLASRAGFCFTLVPARRYAMISPTTIKLTKLDQKRWKRASLPGWKDILIPGFGNADGDVFTNNIRQMLQRMKHPAASETNHNVLDAIGMALAVGRILEGHPAAKLATLEMYEIL